MEKKYPPVTTYFSKDLVEDGVNGCCHDFAIAVHRRTKWPLGVIWRQPSTHPNALFMDRMPQHVYCLTPDGQAIDIEGVSSIERIIEVYGWGQYSGRDREHTVETYATEAEYEKTMLAEFSSMSHMLAPREHGIEAAEKVIKKSAKFLSLLDELTTARA